MRVIRVCVDNTRIESTLETLERRLQALDDSDPPPRTFFDVLGVSRSESAWQRALAYFLSPDEPHGFGTTVLNAFLTLIEDHPDSTFEFYEYDLTDVHVQVEAAGDTGRPDIVLWLEESWFLCLELKVDAAETDGQTDRYTTASRFGDLKTATVPSSGHNFVYLAPQGANAPAADEFIHVEWREIVSAFGPLFDPGIAAYPARSVAQFHDFVRHVQRAIHMVSDHGPNPEKVELAFEHSETLAELTEAADAFIDTYQASWDTRFERNPPDGWTDEWTTIRHGNKWGRLLKTDWTLPQNPSGEPQKTAGFAISVSIDVTRDDFERGETEAVLRVYGDNEYTERYLERFYADPFEGRIRSAVEDTRLTVTDPSGPKPLKSEHPFAFDDGDGHVDALRAAFVEYNEIAPLLEELYFDVRSTIEDPARLFE